MGRLAEVRRGLRRFAASPWTDERIARLKARWSLGVTARQIAWELGEGISSSAVLGKIHRLGFAELSPNAWAHRSQRGGGNQRTSAYPVLVLRLFGGIRSNQQWLPPPWVIEAKPYVDDPAVDADIPFAQRLSLLELIDGACRWPVGDPSRPDFFFCGAEAVQGKPYCAAHCVRARRPAAETKRGAASAHRHRSMHKYQCFDAAITTGRKIADEGQRSGEGT